MVTHSAGSTPHYLAERRWPRHRISLPIRVVVPRPDKTSIVSGRGTDVSEGGLALFAGVELNIGDQVFVEFTPAYSGAPLRVRSIVRNRTGYTYGLEYLYETAAEQETAARFRELLHFASVRGVM